jgi:hypothetical protein
MSNDFEESVNKIQESIMEDARRTYSEKVIERWLNPRNLGNIEIRMVLQRLKAPVET